MDLIQDLSHRLHQSPSSGTIGFLNPFMKELIEVDIRHFVAYNFKHFSDSYAFELMLELKGFLENLSLQDYVGIVEYLKDDFIPLMYFISFVYKYVGVDFAKKEELQKYFQDRPGYLRNTITEIRLLEWHKLDNSCFNDLLAKLVNQGAKASNPLFVEVKPPTSDDEKLYFDSQSSRNTL